VGVDRPVRILLTAVAYDRFWSRVERRGVEALLMESDGSLRFPGGPVIDGQSPAFEVAWSTSDLFFDTGPFAAFFA
jgi:hypothetical protein